MTAATPEQLGFRTPTGNDLISEGDDDITINAGRVVEILNPIRIQLLPSGANWPGVAAGVYRVETYAHAQSLTPALPAELLGAGILRVTAPSSTYKVYEWLGANGRNWRNAYASGALVGWTRMSQSALEVTTVPTSANWPGVSAGIYRVTTYAHAQGLTPALPADLLGAGILRVTEPSTSYKVYEWLGADGSTWRNSWASGALTGWLKVTVGGFDYRAMPNGSNWPTLPDGVYRIQSSTQAGGLTPELPLELRRVGTLRVTTPAPTIKLYEFSTTINRGIWHNYSADGVLAGWTRLLTEDDVTERLGRYVIEGDERLWNPRETLDTNWQQVTPGLEVRRAGPHVHARATSLTVTDGTVLELVDLPPACVPAGPHAVYFGDEPATVDETGIHLQATASTTITGVVTWLTDDPWHYPTEETP